MTGCAHGDGPLLLITEATVCEIVEVKGDEAAGREF